MTHDTKQVLINCYWPCIELQTAEEGKVSEKRNPDRSEGQGCEITEQDQRSVTICLSGILIV